MDKQNARSVWKSIMRNHVAFTGYGHPTTWDYPTLHACYPGVVPVLRQAIALATGEAADARGSK